MTKQPAHFQLATQAERSSYAGYAMKSRTELQQMAVTRSITNARSSGKEDLIKSLMEADG